MLISNLSNQTSIPASWTLGYEIRPCQGNTVAYNRYIAFIWENFFLTWGDETKLKPMIPEDIY
jgi:hypothetical protein